MAWISYAQGTGTEPTTSSISYNITGKTLVLTLTLN